MEPRTRLRRRCHKRRHLLFFEICFEDVAVVPSILFVEENVAKPSRRVRRGCLALRHHARPRNAAAVPALPRAVRASGRSAGTLPQPRAASRPNGSDARAGVTDGTPSPQSSRFASASGGPAEAEPPPACFRAGAGTTGRTATCSRGRGRGHRSYSVKASSKCTSSVRRANHVLYARREDEPSRSCSCASVRNAANETRWKKRLT